MIPLVLCFCLAWSHLLLPVARASCRDGGQFGGALCCQGKDINCVTEGYRVNSAYYHDTCFCDGACADSSDCCSDYESACPATDCVVSSWSYWSGCSVLCGVGVSERRRYKIKDSENAGEKCPPFRQMRACFSSFCDASELPSNGIALLLPYSASERRNDPDLNLMTNFLISLGRYKPFNSYCVYFKLTGLNKKCRSNGDDTEWSTFAKKGTIVCAECDQPAFNSEGRCRGEGIQGKKSRWAALDLPKCRGRWVRTSIEEKCKCNTGSDFIFI
ncbi:somatomedin-B and thrombospondin type-1 domain-containing protein-like [Asterias rubens]|uniref:somatomedin-B and thrombospondin type-1 domain-containing protein-like n=1 Tax=Asterias rubens TaxID=7604 RepID=UPI00145575C9|nr:somatomedin-B and thrombospondin type-1 domain-containing protein-like [Asterias rubens]XP_033627677.1 somatomedin-B and thrombospondin type-1 domain-containing protein-like [Asterias rubens]